MKSKPKKWYKTEWDFSSFYSGITDPKLEKDVEDIFRECKRFADKYAKSSAYLTDESALAKALVDYEALTLKVGAEKSLWYLSLMQAAGHGDESILTPKLNLLRPRLAAARNEVLFFPIKLGKIDLKNQRKFLASNKLKKFSYFLKVAFENGKHNLGEEAEKVLSLKSQPSYSMWVDGVQRLYSSQTVLFKGKKLPISEAMNKIPLSEMKDRRTLHVLCMESLKTAAYAATNELNAIFTDKKIDDELRGFKKPYSSTLLAYQNDEKSIEAMIKVVEDNFKIAHRYYKLKAKLLGLKELDYSDRAAGVGKNQKPVSIDETIKIIQECFGAANPEYRKFFDEMLRDGRIDVFPRKGKRSGAFCSGQIGLPILIMLNFVPSTDWVMVMAHEMGHAIHTKFAKEQPPLYEDYTISVAEVASTFFENIAFEHMYERMSDKEKIVALANRIDDFCQTVFRQVAGFNFELEMHTTLRTKGGLTEAEIVAIHNKHMSSYLGPICKMKDLDGYAFVSWPHLRYFFYLYAYAYGDLISRALYKKYKEDKSYLTKVESFMKAAGSMSPTDIFKNAGIDTTDPEFFRQGLLSVEKDIDRLEKLLNSKK